MRLPGPRLGPSDACGNAASTHGPGRRVLGAPQAPSSRGPAPARTPELMELSFILLFQGSIGGAPVLGIHALPGFQPGPYPA